MTGDESDSESMMDRHTTGEDRVRMVARQLSEPQTANWIASEAGWSHEPTKRVLARLVDDGPGQAHHQERPPRPPGPGQTRRARHQHHPLPEHAGAGARSHGLDRRYTHPAAGRAVTMSRDNWRVANAEPQVRVPSERGVSPIRERTSAETTISSFRERRKRTHSGHDGCASMPPRFHASGHYRGLTGTRPAGYSPPLRLYNRPCRLRAEQGPLLIVGRTQF